MDKLKLCPFCGCQVALDDALESIGRHDKVFYIKCPLCEAQTATGYTVEEAVNAWNRRVNARTKAAHYGRGC